MAYKPDTCRPGVVAGLTLVLLTLGGQAFAATIAWTDWSNVSIPGRSASGTIPGTPTTVTFAGQNEGGNTTGTFNWGPASTYVGGIVGNAPCTGAASCLGDIINLSGNSPPAPLTLTFSAPVTNPVFAVWSLGRTNLPATLTFAQGTAPAIQDTGVNTPWGFGSLTVNGNAVTGLEGNGTFVLPGTFTSIPLTASLEWFYGLTVGVAGTPLAGPVPEPGTMALLASGLLALGGMSRKRS